MAKHQYRGGTTAGRLTRRAGQALVALGASLIALTLGWPALSRTAQPLGATADAAQLCLAAAADAALAENVPLDVLVTVALVESGRDRGAGLAPWAWAIHAQGRGHWPDRREDALAIAQTALDAGLKNIDLGCFQINYRWHAAQFDTLDAMLDPDTNARYAARLLRKHRDRLTSWEGAVGAYHSTTPDLAARYQARFAQLTPQARALQIAARQTPLPPMITATAPAAGAISLHFAASRRPLITLSGAHP
jgi:hypothetical protein